MTISSSTPSVQADAARGLRTTLIAVVVNTLLSVTKILAGIVGNSYALIADGIESTIDIAGSFVVWGGLRIASVPPDENHPYGHGKAESLAGVVVALALMAAGVGLAIQAVREILTPHHAPAPFTLVVLVVVVVTKEILARFVFSVGSAVGSTAVQTDAWHHRSDALTSAAAFVGISVALGMGEGYETADDWATLLACAVMVYNGGRMLQQALGEVMDAAPPSEIEMAVRREVLRQPKVQGVDKCKIRKGGLGWLVDLQIEVDGDLSVRVGHEIAHAVKDALLASPLKILDVHIHVEPSPHPSRGGATAPATPS